MDYKSFQTYAARCKQTWMDSTASVDNPELKSFLKRSYAVLSCPKGQINLDSTDFRTIALKSPESFIPNHASANLLQCVKELEAIKKEFGEDSKLEKARIEKKLQEFDTSELNLEEHRLEIRFPCLRMELIQRIKQMPGVDQHATGREMASIRVVLLVR